MKSETLKYPSEKYIYNLASESQDLRSEWNLDQTLQLDDLQS